MSNWPQLLCVIYKTGHGPWTRWKRIFDCVLDVRICVGQHHRTQYIKLVECVVWRYRPAAIDLIILCIIYSLSDYSHIAQSKGRRNWFTGPSSTHSSWSSSGMPNSYLTQEGGPVGRPAVVGRRINGRVWNAKLAYGRRTICRNFIGEWRAGMAFLNIFKPKKKNTRMKKPSTGRRKYFFYFFRSVLCGSCPLW